MAGTDSTNHSTGKVSDALELPAGIDDININIHPRWATFFYGTAEQLIAEGLIPTGFIWPERTHRKHFKNGIFECEVARDRPPNTTGPKSTWVNGDYWRLNRHMESYNGCAEADIYEKTMELKRVIDRNSPAHAVFFEKYWAAHKDVKFQAFKTLLIGEKKRGRGRPSKTVADKPAEAKKRGRPAKKAVTQ